MAAMFSRRALRRGLGEADVLHLYRTLLDRDPLRAEVVAQLAVTRDWRALLRAITASDEFRNGRPTAAVALRDVVVNIWHPDLARGGTRPARGPATARPSWASRASR